MHNKAFFSHFLESSKTGIILFLTFVWYLTYGNTSAVTDLRHTNDTTSDKRGSPIVILTLFPVEDFQKLSSADFGNYLFNSLLT